MAKFNITYTVNNIKDKLEANIVAKSIETLLNNAQQRYPVTFYEFETNTED